MSRKTVAASMDHQGVQGRHPKPKRRSLIRPDNAAANPGPAGKRPSTKTGEAHPLISALYPVAFLEG